jgi:hypothetical protein
MPKTVFITLNNSGTDLGPYDLTLVDGSNNETPWSSNPVTKAQLTAGYQMVVPDIIVKVKVKSKTCTTYVLLTIPTTLCPCRTVKFKGTPAGSSSFIFYECGNIESTTLNLGNMELNYCVDTNKLIIQNTELGEYEDTGVCCS